MCYGMILVEVNCKDERTKRLLSTIPFNAQGSGPSSVILCVCNPRDPAGYEWRITKMSCLLKSILQLKTSFHIYQLEQFLNFDFQENCCSYSYLVPKTKFEKHFTSAVFAKDEEYKFNMGSF